MSSDCYIDFFNTEEDRDNYKNLIESERIGHLGTLNYFGTQFLDILQTLQKEKPIINEGWKAVVIEELMAFFL